MQLIRVLTLGAAALTAAAAGAQDGRGADDGGVWSYLAGRYDADGDGEITLAEYGRSKTHFDRLDADGDGILTAADVRRLDGRRAGRGAGGRGADGRDAARDPAPVEGERAPDFTLEVLERPPAAAMTAHARAVRDAEVRGEAAPPAPADADELPLTLRLSDYAALERPVALVFGSYT